MTTTSHIEVLHSAAYQAKLDTCLHCGLCLPACPTYALNGREAQAPRGRISLMRGAAEGRIGLDDPALAEHLGSCLTCRACEPACPSGVRYGELVEVARAAIHEAQPPARAERFAAWLGLRQLMPHLGRLRAMALGAWLYERSGAQALVRRSGLLRGHLRAAEAIAPPIRLRRRADGKSFPARGARRGRVAVLQGCIQEAFLGQVNDATVRVLQRNGFEVVIPRGQTCCGAAQLHGGDEETARELARRNIDALLAADVDSIISNAGGCGAALKDYPHLLRDDGAYRTRVAAFVAKVRDISEFLAQNAVEPPRATLPARATYVDSCHLRNAQKVVRQPRDLLRAIPGLELVELRQPERCCGSAGVYNLTHPELAEPILDAKIADIRGTGADLVVVANTGCHMQILSGVRQAGLQAQVLHVVEVLDRAYALEGARGHA
jgi:glycolate oxidase iron-sulfur subunit